MRIIDESRAAVALGMTTFISSKPCINCGGKERRVACEGQTACVCVKCSRAHAKKYRDANTEKCRQAQAEWREKNRDYRRAYCVARRARLKEVKNENN